MSTVLSNQIAGILRVLGPVLVTWLIARGILPQDIAGPFVDGLLILIATGISAYSSWRSNSPDSVAKQVASEPGVTVLVGEEAPSAVRAVAADPAVPSVLPTKPIDEASRL